MPQYNFTTFPFATSAPDLIIKLIKSLMRGFMGMMEKGIIHGNITPENLQVVSIDNPQAIITNMGNAVAGRTSTQNSVANGYWKHTCAPELFAENAKLYQNGEFTSKADMWSLGISILIAIDRLPPSLREGRAINELWNMHLQRYIWQLPQRKPQYNVVALLLKNLTKFEPEYRDCSLAEGRLSV